ncbi:hypothetical protein DPMN_171364 [Dreissena polymorpha]|uniref:Uncharacterized protein n=1 Tax=Dreissena polymorpha TaxID=45954 RepID=A0A9D4E123_DREPO|nr:hypothetical protein DPMN_171364 [Dreissena polymorpha]
MREVLSTQLQSSRVMEVLLDPVANEPRHGSAPHPAKIEPRHGSAPRLATNEPRHERSALHPAEIEPRHGSAPRPSYKRAASWKCTPPS